jgi:hypothetical protein
MANDLSNVVKLHYAEATQENLEKSLTSMDLAGMIDIPNGTTKNLPYVKMRATGNYTKYTNQTIQDVATGNDQIVINTTPMVTFAMDVIDEGDDYIDVKPEVIEDASYQIKKRIDGDFFAQVSNAKWKYDANGFGRNTGTLSPITLVTGASQNISTTFGKAKAGLTNNGANGSALALCVDDFISADLTTLGMETSVAGVADVSYTRGFQGKFGGMNTYSVSMLTSSTTLDLATAPADGDTVTIQGVTFTFKTTLGSTAGNVLIGGTAAAANTNLTALLNAPGTTTAQGVALDADDAALIEQISAVATATTTVITSKNGALMASSTMTTAANDFQAQVINACIMEKGAIKMAIRNGVKVYSRDEPLKLVTNYFIYARYGLKVTTRSKERMVIIPIVTAAAEL